MLSALVCLKQGVDSLCFFRVAASTHHSTGTAILTSLPYPLRIARDALAALMQPTCCDADGEVAVGDCERAG